MHLSASSSVQAHFLWYCDVSHYIGRMESDSNGKRFDLG
jgi:hypothetical protein